MMAQVVLLTAGNCWAKPKAARLRLGTSTATVTWMPSWLIRMSPLLPGYRPFNRVWLNDGQGTFTAGQPLGRNRSMDVALADLDGDGDLDAFVANYRAENPTQIWLNDGTGNFGTGQRLDLLSRAVALGDLDRDGDIDALLSTHILVNDSTGSFTSRGRIESKLFWGASALHDWNGDGHLDVFIMESAGRGDVWLSDGAGDFAQTGQDLPSINGWNLLAAGDLDGDGDVDVMHTPQAIRFNGPLAEVPVNLSERVYLPLLAK